MINYTELPRNQIICLDMKSFYASVEAVHRGLNPLTTLLAVVGDPERKGSVVLAASPQLKAQFRIKTGNRLFEIPSDPRIWIVPARMGVYLNVSMAITKMLNRFAPIEAIHPYSIDEAWICLNGTEKLFGPVQQAARLIQECIQMETGLPSAIGIGPNKLLAKLVLDNFAKKTGIAECQYEDVPRLLWPLPIQKIWGIGSRMTAKLNRMGIYTLGNLAAYPLERLRKKFGIMGEQLYFHAWGVDLSPIYINPNEEVRKGFSNGITLFRDYNKEDVRVVVLELADQVTSRMRRAHVAARTVSLALGYSKDEARRSYSRSRTLLEATHITKYVYQGLLTLLNGETVGAAIRTVHVGASNLISADYIQPSLFDIEEDEKLTRLAMTIDHIHNRFGPTALIRACSLTDAGIARDRANKIGGHHQ